MWALSFLPNLKIIGLRTSSYESLDFLLMLWVTVFWSPDLLPLIYNNSSLSAQLDVNSPSTRRESQSEASVWQIDSKINHGLVSFSPKSMTLQKIPKWVDSESAGLEGSGATRIFNRFETLFVSGGRPNSMEFAIKKACRLSKKKPVRTCGTIRKASYS